MSVAERAGQMTCCEQYGKAFAAWDLRLYLDTHPNDAQAIALFAQLCSECGGGNYACRGIRACDYEDGIWHYLDGPWPWEPDANCRVDASRMGKGGR